MHAVGSRAFKRDTRVQRPVPLRAGSRQPRNFQNHEAGGAAQKTAFQWQVKSPCDVVSRTGNPLLDDFSELVTLDRRDCADTSDPKSVKTLDKLGKDQYQKYVQDVIKDRSRSIQNPIMKNNLPFFSKNHKKEASKQGEKNCSSPKQFEPACPIVRRITKP